MAKLIPLGGGGGGGSFDPHSPGTIGDVSPGAMHATALTVTITDPTAVARDFVSAHDATGPSSTPYMASFGLYSQVSAALEDYGSIDFCNNSSRIGWVNIAQFSDTGMILKVPLSPFSITDTADETTDTPLLHMSQTRDNVATVFNALILDLTDTAVDPGSTAIQVLVNSSPAFVVYDSGAVAATGLISGGSGLASGGNVLMDNNPCYLQMSDTNYNNAQMGIDASNNLALIGTDPDGNPVAIWTVPVANATPVFDFQVPVQFSSVTAPGAGSALLGTNSPSAHLSAPYAWANIHASDGTACVMPMWEL